MTNLPWPENLARRAVQRLSPYSARGGSTTALHLDANESPYAPPPVSSTKEFNRYPAQQPEALSARLADLYGVQPEQLMVGRGADEALEVLTRTFCEEDKDAVLISTPTFGYYKTCADICGAQIIDVPLKSDFTWNEDALIEAAKADNLKLAFVCSPNNPSGNSCSLDLIEQFCQTIENGFVVVDEAYQEFSSRASALSLLPKYKNLIVLRTLSKAYAMAGVRLGVAICDPAINAVMMRVLPPYPIPRPVEVAALNALSSAAMPVHSSRMNEWLSERERLKTALPKSEYIDQIYPTDANFILGKLSDYDGAVSALRRANIKIRTYPAIPDHVRISIGSPAENDLLLTALGVQSKKSKADRIGEAHRKTKETDIAIRVNLDDPTLVQIDTGLGFFDHMLESFAKHSGIGLTLACTGDLHIDAHHTVEDCALALGGALKSALGDKAGIGRFGFVMPMDETQARVAIDLSGRPAMTFNGEFPSDHVGAFPTEMCPHFFESLAQTLGAAIQIDVEGENSHHIIEASFKGVARALKPAFAREGSAIPSTKGVL